MERNSGRLKNISVGHRVWSSSWPRESHLITTLGFPSKLCKCFKRRDHVPGLSAMLGNNWSPRQNWKRPRKQSLKIILLGSKSIYTSFNKINSLLRVITETQVFAVCHAQGPGSNKSLTWFCDLQPRGRRWHTPTDPCVGISTKHCKVTSINTLNNLWGEMDIMEKKWGNFRRAVETLKNSQVEILKLKIIKQHLK